MGMKTGMKAAKTMSNVTGSVHFRGELEFRPLTPDGRGLIVLSCPGHVGDHACSATIGPMVLSRFVL